MIKKRIAFALPTSHYSELFGYPETGCYFIEYENSNTLQTIADLQVGGFPKICSDLKESFKEADGIPCRTSKRLHPEYYE